MRFLVYLTLLLALAGLIAAGKGGSPTAIQRRAKAVSIKIRVNDGMTFNDTNAIKQAILRAVPGLNSDDIIVELEPVSKKRITYNAYVSIIGTSAETMDAALDSANYSKTVAAISNEISKIPDVSEAIDFVVTGTPAVEITPLVDQSPQQPRNGAPCSPPSTPNISSNIPKSDSTILIRVSTPIIILSIICCLMYIQ
jgi:hypothetical protein